jgi:phosphatidylglycerophosphate synthase
MLDLMLRPIKEQMLAPVADAIGRRVSPMSLTIAAFVVGLAAAVLVARAAFFAGLVFWFANRLLDGLDGTVARAQGTQSDFGGYADIVLDFIVYAAIPIAFVVAAPHVATCLAALALLASFYVNAVNAASWMYLAAVLERRDAGARRRGELTTVTMPEGLVGGTETMLLYALFFVWPERIVLLFGLMSVLVLLTIVKRVAWAARRL